MEFGDAVLLQLPVYSVFVLDLPTIVKFSKGFTSLKRHWYVNKIRFYNSEDFYLKNGLGIAVGLFAWCIAASGIAFYFMDHYDSYYDFYMNWNLWGIWISEFLFIFGKRQIIDDPYHMGHIS